VLGLARVAARSACVDRVNAPDHHHTVITNLCTAALSKKASLPGAWDRRAR
jgi:hypothetical protein